MVNRIERTSKPLIRALFPIRRCKIEERTDLEESRYQHLFSQVKQNHGFPYPTNLYRLRSLNNLIAFIEGEIRELLAPDYLWISKRVESSPFFAFQEAALSFSRLIYFPSRNAYSIFTYGKTSKGGKAEAEILEILPKQLGLEPAWLPKEFEGESFIFVPVLPHPSKRPSKLPRNCGTIILVKRQPYGFNHLVHLPILALIGEDFARALAKNRLSL
jgi:hypothetical protein